MKNNQCPSCHATIPTNAPGGFCPSCLLRDAEEPLTQSNNAPSLEKIAAAFPQLEILELIGQGGMGFVYKVRQPSLDRIVALKILSPELSRDPAFAERFAREARTLGKLHHPNIVMIFEHGEKDSFFYLIMEYVDGVNLRQAMQAGRFTPEQALSIVPGICDALQIAHEQGIWHRDIKPENILLDREGRVKIADFGIARIVGDPQRDFTLTHTGNALGSAAYMAPEQQEKPHSVDHRADIYSLGVVLYEMLTGELPLGRFPAPSRRTAVDERIDEIVFKTLEKERDLRQQSATEVKTDVHRAIQSQSKIKDRLTRSEDRANLGVIAFCLLLFAITSLPLLVIYQPALKYIISFSVIPLIIAAIVGLIAFRNLLGKSTVIASILILLTLSGIVFLNPPKTLELADEKITTQNNPNPAEVEAAFELELEPLVEQAIPTPTVPVDEVFRKAVTAANQSDGIEFSKYIHINTYPGNTNLEMLEKFRGEITELNAVVSSEYELDGEAKVYSRIRRNTGEVEYLIVGFDNKDGHWIGLFLIEPRYQSYCKFEFKPPIGDPTQILRTHISSAQLTYPFQPVNGEPFVYEIRDESFDPQYAKEEVDQCIENLRDSLKRFGLDSALKVITPAVAAEEPYMGKD